MNIIKTWKGKNALKNCEKEYKETIVVDAKKDIDHIDLVELNDDVLKLLPPVIPSNSLLAHH